MSREQIKHAVRLNIGANVYNALIAALKQNQSGDNDIITERADALLSKIERYARFYSENGEDYAEIRFFESEARYLIWQLIAAFAYHSSDDEDYYHAVSNAEQSE